MMLFHSTWFCYNVDEMVWNLSSCLYQSMVKLILLYIVLLKISEAIDDVK